MPAHTKVGPSSNSTDREAYDQGRNGPRSWQRLTATGPVFITDRGKPTFALLKIEDYYKLSGKTNASIVDLLALPGDDISFDPPRADIQLQVPEFD